MVRGGLQALPKGQVEAAQALGLTYWQTTRKIVLPQALRLVVPAIVNSFISTFKDTSLVTIVSLYDLTGALQLALGDADWRKFFLEGQLFVAAVYFVLLLRAVALQPLGRGHTSTPACAGNNQRSRGERDHGHHRRTDHCVRQRQQVVRPVPRAARHPAQRAPRASASSSAARRARASPR